MTLKVGLEQVLLCLLNPVCLSSLADADSYSSKFMFPGICSVEKQPLLH